MIKLLTFGEVQQMRREFARRPQRMPGHGLDVAKVVSSGRPTCRSCGRKIKKGESALVTFYDFHGAGFESDPWTCTEVFIHAEPCEGTERHISVRAPRAR